MRSNAAINEQNARSSFDMHLELPQSIAKDSYGMLWIASASREIGNRSVDIGHWLKTGHDFHCFHWFSIVIIVLLFLLLLQLQLPPLLLRLLLSRSGAGSSCTVFSAIGVQLGEFHQVSLLLCFSYFPSQIPRASPSACLPWCFDALFLSWCAMLLARIGTFQTINGNKSKKTRISWQ